MTDEQIKKYFLGELSEAESFEEICAQDAELTEQAQIIESELIDAYLRGELSAAERKSFENNYLITGLRREKLKFAKEFLNSFKEVPSEVKPQISYLQVLLGGFRPRLVFAGLLTILLFGGFVLVWLNWQKKIEIAEQTTPTFTPIPTPKVENQNVQPIENVIINNQKTNVSTNLNTQPNKNVSPTPQIKTTQTPKPTEPSAPTLASFTLLPGTLRSEGEQFIKIAPNVGKVNLRLRLPKEANKYETYTATIKTADGETVATFSNTKFLNLNFSANKLEKRTYIIFLEGQNTPNPAESIAEYTFRVRR